MLSMRSRVAVLGGAAVAAAVLASTAWRATGDRWWLALACLGGAAMLATALPAASLVAAHREHLRYGGVPSGAEWLIGRTAVVVRPLAPEGVVAVHGELWRARSVDGREVPPGAEIVVAGCTGLRLDVVVVPAGVVTAPTW